MTINQTEIKVGGITATLIRKQIKNLHLSVLPPDGKVRVSAPQSMSDDAIKMLIATRLAWIKKQQNKYRTQERQTPREYVSGETHYYFGKGYRLEVLYENQPQRVYIKGKSKIVVSVRPGADKEKRKQIMQAWYRRELESFIAGKLSYWEDKIGVHVKELKIKRMKTRWGTCNSKVGRIWLNTELAKKAPQCIEYVLVHEMIHLLVTKHNDIFKQHMDRFFPKWQYTRDELNKSPLAYEVWDY